MEKSFGWVAVIVTQVAPPPEERKGSVVLESRPLSDARTHKDERSQKLKDIPP